MNQLLATIVILSYNNTHLLEKAINSAIRQDYPNIEIIIHDDASKIFDRKQIESYFKDAKENIKNIIIHTNTKNLGTVKNFNYAIEKMSGDVVIPLACDDQFYSDSTVSTIMERFNNGAKVCTARRIGQISRIIKPTDAECKLIKFGGYAFAECLLYSYFVSGACTYYSKDVLEQYGLFDINYKLIEDQPFILNYVLAGNLIELIDEITIVYHEEGVSNGSTPNQLCWQDQQKIFERIIIPKSNTIACNFVKRYIQYKYKSCFGNTNNLLVKIHYIDVITIRFLERVFHCNYYIERLAKVK